MYAPVFYTLLICLFHLVVQLLSIEMLLCISKTFGNHFNSFNLHNIAEIVRFFWQAMYLMSGHHI